LHPAAAGVLLAALREASGQGQILVTSHSPDLLDSDDIPTDAILAVENDQGLTRIGGIDDAGREMLMKKLFTPGELLKQNQLSIDANAVSEMENHNQLKLFDFGE
jgi:hypothetical protein